MLGPVRTARRRHGVRCHVLSETQSAPGGRRRRGCPRCLRRATGGPRAGNGGGNRRGSRGSRGRPGAG
eukprot:1999048-Pleurochrysis_carterae.AAC.1